MQKSARLVTRLRRQPGDRSRAQGPRRPPSVPTSPTRRPSPQPRSTMAAPGPAGAVRSRRGGWGSWGGPGRGRVQICCKGAPGRDRPREEPRNINDSLPALRRDPGLCNRFGQLDVADPCADGGLGDHPGLRAGPPRSWASRCAFCTRAGTSNRTSRGRNAPLESRMHISRAKCTSRRAQDRSTPPPRTAPARATPTHGPRLPVRKAQ